ncbi:ATP-grasp domain-containing protein [Psychroserpens sp.]|uniref:ATP-grasp domain-containing protein n=1 Tax=Psychroserpens sp. TaxID=2020870 RepID=UPI001B1A0BE0|nr:ATP-grasp domain-containing protein [Psychroserpens sp.]MBO6606488.1 ATP-grasp domain-containing protein [Psychroserpens sp.]MBO6632459.1 ATP-grasp domain-containing protein [Psychroserpens sp.]MBO6653192.1 ATP-grasp domain-containing protein [Psychroserpens sp.]MBO6680780.1 ATP-grasp domain-containing protein [Psychroserpens sp.]MBO6750262.1 ATP-grasp domain-containing protein [Psychroserpens sp.]
MAINILFTCAGRRNYLINYFKDALKGNGQIIAADMSLTAPAMVDADLAIVVPGIYENHYIDELKTIIVEHNINAVISLNDLELPVLSAHKDELEQLGATVVISDPEIISIAFDKVKTFNFLKSIGLNTPLTYTNIDTALLALKSGELSFPLVVKPRWGSASIGIDFPESVEELELAFRLQHLKLKKSILNQASQVDIDNAILIQEKLNGVEYGMDVLNDFNGAYVGSFVRKKLNMRSGETDKAVSVIDEQFEKIGRTIGTQLKHIGNLDCDVFMAKNQLYVLELNPRFGGGYPFSHEAGIDTAAIYIEWLKGQTDIAKYNNYKSGVAFAKCDRMLRIKDA